MLFVIIQVPSLPDEIEFSSVWYLNVSHNTLRTLPRTLNAMRCLTDLIASHNEISSLPDTLCYMKRLQVNKLIFNY